MKTIGRHLLVEYLDCDASILDDKDMIEKLLIEAAEAAGTTVVASVIKSFEPQGVSGVVVIEESHLSVHTWPENAYAAVDFFTCGNGDPLKAHNVIYKGLKAQKSEYKLFKRGNIEEYSVIQMLEYKCLS